MTLSAEPLVSFVSKLGIDETVLADSEEKDRLSLLHSIRGSDLTRLVEQDRREVVEAYRDALHYEVRFGDFVLLDQDDPVAKIQAGSDYTEDDELDLRITLEKPTLLRRVLGEAPAGQTRSMFLFEAALGRVLSTGPQGLEGIWDVQAESLLILAADLDIHLEGPAIAVFGAGAMDSAREWRPPGVSGELATSAREHRDRHVRWDHPYLEFLTPIQLGFDAVRGQGTRLAELVARCTISTAVMYLADRVTGPSTGTEDLTVDFRGTSTASRVPIRRQGLDGLDPQHVAATVDLASWVYAVAPEAAEREWVADRLAFVQNRASQSLATVELDHRLEAVARQASSMLDGLRWDWKSFIEGRVASFLDRTHELQQFISETVQRYTRTTTEIVRSLVETVLAAMAALVGAFLAAALRDPFDDQVLRLVLIAYGVYVLLFPGLIRMTSQWQQHGALKDELSHLRTTYAHLLSTERVDDIVGDRVSDAQANFCMWFTVAVVLLIVIAGGAFAGAAWLPESLAS